ncbi:MAG TPA: hypothetical protein VK745_23465, partial [Polyangiaceae bacterium]|nr:hypothetical protein [Polyangiaceae bacterium]
MKRTKLERRALFGLVGAVLLLSSAAAWAGTYLNSAALLLAQASHEADYLRARINDKELAELVHKLADAR